jgi:outer membrane protein OmpA-like peptidoglycan-associated protein
MGNAHQIIVSRSVLLCCVSAPLLSSGQNLSGHWIGSLLQDDKTYGFTLEVDMQQTGTHISGQSKLIAEPGLWILERFEGEIRGDIIEWRETKVIDYSPFPGGDWCIKKFLGSTHQQQGKLLLSGSWSSNQLYNGTYYAGSCAPGHFLLSRKLPATLPLPVKSTTGKIQRYHRSPTRLVQHTVTPPTVEKAPRKEVATLKNVLFNQGEAVLLPSAQVALTPLVTRLQAAPSLHVRIDGHTDRIGEAAKNILLSQQRAQAVKRYLIQQGIAAARIETAGYGDTRLVCPPPCEANRRVEVAFIP